MFFERLIRITRGVFEKYSLREFPNDGGLMSYLRRAVVAGGPSLPLRACVFLTSQQTDTGAARKTHKRPPQRGFDAVR